MNRLIQKLSAGKVLVSDGAWGTFLQKKGLQPGECPELWNITRPGDVFDIAKSYIDAGSDMIETNSFGGSSFKLKNYGLEDRVFEINKAAAAISRKAAGADGIVLGSVGPTGKLLLMEEVTEDELYQCFSEQSRALEAGGADAIVIETMTDLEEARIAVKAARENTSCEVICTLTFDKLVTGEYKTMMGISPEEMIGTLKEAGASVIGTNCGNGISGMIEIVKAIRATDKHIPILVQSNAGLPVYCDGETVYPESPDDMASKIKELVDAGANIVGGCCGTTPEHILKVCQIVNGL